MLKGNVLTTYTYDPANARLQDMVTGNLQDLSYTYNTAGYITAISDNINPNWDQTFVYDVRYLIYRVAYPRRNLPQKWTEAGHY
jgi:YD repeat-containing protein